VGVDLLTMQALHQLFMLQLQQHFDHACDTSGQFQMPDVAFYRTDPTRGFLQRSPPYRLRELVPSSLECIDLDRIPQSSPGSVCLNVTHCARIDLGLEVGCDQQIGLCSGIRGRERARSEERRVGKECRCRWVTVK